MYENLEDYICDQKVKDKNCSHDDVAGSTKEAGDVDKDVGVTHKETPPEEHTDPNPDHLTTNSKKSEPEGSQKVEKVNHECDSQAAQAAIVVSNEVPQPVSKDLTLPSGPTSHVNTIGQNEPTGTQLQMATNDSENNIPSANDSNQDTVPQTDGTHDDEAMYENNSAVDPNKCNQPMDENNCPVDQNNYVPEKNSNVAETDQIHATNGTMNTNCIIGDKGSDVDSKGEFEIKHEDPEDEEIKLLVYQRDVDKYFQASLWAKYPCRIHNELVPCEKCERSFSLI